VVQTLYLACYFAWVRQGQPTYEGQSEVAGLDLRTITLLKPTLNPGKAMKL
jgi:hypothetical protein